MSMRRVALWHRTCPFGRRPMVTHESPRLAGWISAASNDRRGLVDWPRAASNRRETMPTALNMARASAAHLRTPKLSVDIGWEGACDHPRSGLQRPERRAGSAAVFTVLATTVWLGQREYRFASWRLLLTCLFRLCQ